LWLVQPCALRRRFYLGQGRGRISCRQFGMLNIEVQIKFRMVQGHARKRGRGDTGSRFGTLSSSVSSTGSFFRMPFGWRYALPMLCLFKPILVLGRWCLSAIHSTGHSSTKKNTIESTQGSCRVTILNWHSRSVSRNAGEIIQKNPLVC
jgi:hypothetical protein